MGICAHPIKNNIYVRTHYDLRGPGKSMSAHAEELEKSYFQLTRYVAQENLGIPAE